MSDLIDRDALIAAYDAAHKGPPGGARKLMVEAPAVDAVEVVRCKDCVSYNNHFSQGGFGWCEEEALRIVNDNFYCGYAKRVEKDG